MRGLEVLKALRTLIGPRPVLDRSVRPLLARLAVIVGETRAASLDRYSPACSAPIPVPRLRLSTSDWAFGQPTLDERARKGPECGIGRGADSPGYVR